MMVEKSKKHKIFIFGCLLWDIICRPIVDPEIGDDNSGIITEKPGGVAYNIALGLGNELDNKLFSIYLVSVTGRSHQTKIQLEKLKNYGVKTNHLIFKGESVDKYVSIETKGGEIYSSVNSCEVFSQNEPIVYNQFLKILSDLNTKDGQSTFIFDGNLSKNFLSKILKEPKLENFSNYFIPANFKKLCAFSDYYLYFKNFSLLLNIREASTIGKKNFSDSVDACKYLANLLDNKFQSIVVTNGSKVASGIKKKKLFMLKPTKLTKKSSKSGAGDFFFANYIATNLLKPKESNKKKLKYANERTHQYLKHLK